jgi:hypothetical protein
MFGRFTTLFLLLALALGGCLSAFHREEVDNYIGASASYRGNGRTTTMQQTASAPVPTPAPPALKQAEPALGRTFILMFNGHKYEAMKKTDGRIYILREVE